MNKIQFVVEEIKIDLNKENSEILTIFHSLLQKLFSLLVISSIPMFIYLLF
ncbi:Uncharacterised protein [Niallia circulans]|jgi:hypothetical protein|uniref:hypothetical protein n=1 Tax=Niallia TaxID=2837506 RepID=UPI000A895E54|nr:hypothetical protein [Niallia circulans]MCM2983038.1 hypothetical protein [Niallia circulans]MED3840978.1 hypothetical protein [Niallia circulans]MED4242878.1 hypothetical protein [Niallia circulans]MED4246857.1 hypothetical protein [Niallia circulans]MED5102655.1 hypothetical protein [Niallia circulans]